MMPASSSLVVDHRPCINDAGITCQQLSAARGEIVGPAWALARAGRVLLAYVLLAARCRCPLEQTLSAQVLVEAGLDATGLRTRHELVDFALRELLRHEQQKRLLALKGKVSWEGNLDEMRAGHDR